MPERHQQRAPWLEQAFDFATQEATGQLVIISPNGDHSWLWLRDGQLTGVSAPARRPLLAQRLMSFGVLDSRTTAKALASAREHPGLRLIDVVMAENLAPETFLLDYLLASAAEQMRQIQDSGVRESRFHPGRTQRLSPLLLDLHEVVSAAQSSEQRIQPEIANLAVSALPDVIPTSKIHESLISASDGHRTPIQLADFLGLTIQETSSSLTQLVADGSVELVSVENVNLTPADEVLPAPFPREDNQVDEPPASTTEISDLPPPTAPTETPTEVELPAYQRISGAFTPAKMERETSTTSQRSGTAPAPVPELQQMASELAPSLPEGADLPEHEEVPQHKIVGDPLDHKDAASLLTSLSHGQPEEKVSEPAPVDAPPPAMTPPPVQVARPPAGVEPAMRPDLLGELHSVQDPNDSGTPTESATQPAAPQQPKPAPKRRRFGR